MRHETGNRRHGERAGVVTLVMVLVLGGVIVELSLAGILLVTLLNNENFGIQLSARALAAAQSGVSEGLLRIVRDKDFVQVSGGFNQLPVLDTGSASAMVYVCKDSTEGGSSGCGNNSSPGVYEIISVGSVLGRKRTIVAVAEVDDITGLVTVVAYEEKAL